ncbi:MAG: hypothetical protein IPI00_00640 [Flavobacteriales bacterium]|nr:hypothetical protein [Flavobacteriales bacterium]MBK6946343.1 hypothetical protein [Flavobacteriales bacterium]MBK7238697.1 hypothetical protein [Flavobacteriales bacterium]MBK7297728.1 hypothetical protein [Flavobacteriales bacterium]MBK9536391.1 hypothetical protein [Flavobacteriales bacterium]
MNFQPLHKRTLLHTILFVIAIGFSVMANAQGHVIFKGRVLRTDITSPAVSMIVTDGVDTMDVMIGRHGKYNFAIPTNEIVSVILTSENYITKEIKLDTHNAPEAKGPFARTAQVEFYVELEPQSTTQPMMYSGLAGSIYFAPQGEGVRTMIVPTPQPKNMLVSNTFTAAL